MNFGAALVYIALFILTIYNVRRNYHLMKLRSNANIREPEKLSQDEQSQLKGFNSDKRKWSILSQFFFFTALFLAFKGTLAQLAFFMDLYTVSVICVNNIDIDIVKLLGQSSGSQSEQ